MFRKLSDALRRFMYGRYGTDGLNMAIVALSAVLLLLGAFLWRGCTLLAYVLLGWCIFRICSKNHAARQKENAAWQNLTAPLRDREHRYFRCPGCRKTLRVPKGKGKIAITCPRCRRRFEKRT